MFLNLLFRVLLSLINFYIFSPWETEKKKRKKKMKKKKKKNNIQCYHCFHINIWFLLFFLFYNSWFIYIILLYLIYIYYIYIFYISHSYFFPLCPSIIAIKSRLYIYHKHWTVNLNVFEGRWRCSPMTVDDRLWLG